MCFAKGKNMNYCRWGRGWDKLTDCILQEGLHYHLPYALLQRETEKSPLEKSGLGPSPNVWVGLWLWQRWHYDMTKAGL